MQLPTPDPAFTRSERARANFRLAVKISLCFVGLLWFFQFLNWGLDLDPGDLGVRPREAIGLLGILFAPLTHGDFAHLIANTPPLVVLGTVMLTLYPQSSLRVFPIIYFGPGIAVWLFGRGSSHIGASGLIYGMVSYVLVAGLLRRDRRAIAASLLVCFMYGSLVWGLVPIQPRVSWETHLAAAIIGVILALVLRRLDIPPVVRYAWEGEREEEMPEAEPAVADFDASVEREHARADHANMDRSPRTLQ